MNADLKEISMFARAFTAPVPMLVLALLPALPCLLLASPCIAAPAPQAAGETGPLPAERLRADLPPGAVEIAPAAKNAAIGSPIVLRGRVPLASDAFVPGKAILLLVDEEAARHCCGAAPSGGKPDAHPKASADAPCAAPPGQRATIVFADGAGVPLAVELRDRHGLRPGAEVFVAGEVATPDQPGTLKVVAQTIHVPRAALPIGALVATEPAGGRDVAEVRKAAKKGDTVVLVGRIGGSAQPFVPGRAMFTLVGRGIKACSDIPGDECPKPWDYCCETKEAILANSATVQFVDTLAGAKGGPLRTDIKGRAGIKELSELVVVGTVAVAEKGALVVNATQVFVR